MDASIISLLAQIPLVGIFVWWSNHQTKLAASERKERDESWQALLVKSDESQTAIAEGHVGALREIARECRARQEATEQRLLDGQAMIRRGNAKVVALLVAQITKMEVKDAKTFVQEILAD